MTLVVSIAAGFAVLHLILMISERTTAGRFRLVSRYALRVALPVTDDVADAIERRLLRRGLFSGVIGLLGLGAYVALIVLTPELSEVSLSGPILLGFYCAGLAGGVSLAALRPFVRPDADQPRVARASSPALGDYLSPFRMVLAGACTGLGVLTVALVLPFSEAFATAPALALASSALGIGALGVLIATIVLSRRILQSPQPAADSTQLAWDDAFRAQALRDLWASPLAIGLAAALLPLTFIGVSGLLFPLVSLITLLPLLALAGGPGTRFQRRLWPDTIPGGTNDDASSSEKVTSEPLTPVASTPAARNE